MSWIHAVITGIVLSASAACSDDAGDFGERPKSGGSGGKSPIDASVDRSEDAGDHALDATSDQLGDALADGSDSGLTEPTALNTYTFVHGLVDAKTIAFCFRQVVGGVTQLPSAQMTPPDGLEYGGSITRNDPGGLDPGGDDFRVMVIAGDLSLVPDKGCQSALQVAESLQDAGASSPPLRVATLELIPHGTLQPGRVLVVASGCMGGSDFVAPEQELACGNGYSPSNPTIGAAIVNASRITLPDRVGLQAVNASRAGAVLDFATVSNGVETSFAKGVGYASVAPWPPVLDSNAASLAANTIRIAAGSTVLLEQSWPVAPVDGRVYAVVVVGSHPSLAPANWWNAAKLVTLPYP